MSKKQVLVYGFGDQEQAVCQLIEARHLTPRPVSAGELDLTIGQLCSTSPAPSDGNPALPAVNQAILIFHNVGRKDLDGLLEDLKQADLPVRSLKAMVTDTNKKWPLRHLAGELEEESRIMTALSDLKKLRDSVSIPPVLDLQLMTALFQVDRLMAGQMEVTMEAILQTRKNLLDALNK